MLYSECCGAAAGDFEDVGMCPDCKEHCSWIDDDNFAQEQIDTARTLGDRE